MGQLSLWPTVADDDGTFTVGTVFNSDLTSAFRAAVEDDIYSLNNPTTKTKTIIDEVVAARGTAADLNTRLSVVLGPDGNFLTGVTRRLTTDLTVNQNNNASLTALTQYVLTGNTLITNGQVIRVTAAGILGSNGNTKVISFIFGATAITFASSSGSGLHWRSVIEIYRAGSTSQLLNGSLFINTSGAENVLTAAPAETLSGVITLGFRGQGTATGDIVQKSLLVEFLS